MNKQRWCLLLGISIFLPIAPVLAKPMVLSSLKPLTLIAQEITGEQANTDTLMPITASHHDYPLKVSDYSRIQKADLILWIGPELESFLQKPLANLSATKIITAYNLPGMNWPADDTHAVGEEHSTHNHGHDPHLWLDPRNAVIVARTVSEKLSQLDTANAKIYAKNFQVFSAKMLELDEKLTISLKPVTAQGFAVYHEGYSHFTSHYGLHQLDYVTLTPEQKPGAKHLHQLREELAKEGKCLFLEPYNDMQSARDLAQELQLKLGILDAMGGQNIVSYPQLLTQMAEAFSACLTNRRSQ